MGINIMLVSLAVMFSLYTLYSYLKNKFEKEQAQADFNLEEIEKWNRYLRDKRNKEYNALMHKQKEEDDELPTRQTVDSSMPAAPQPQPQTRAEKNAMTSTFGISNKRQRNTNQKMIENAEAYVRYKALENVHATNTPRIKKMEAAYDRALAKQEKERHVRTTEAINEYRSNMRSYDEIRKKINGQGA